MDRDRCRCVGVGEFPGDKDSPYGAPVLSNKLVAEVSMVMVGARCLWSRRGRGVTPSWSGATVVPLMPERGSWTDVGLWAA